MGNAIPCGLSISSSCHPSTVKLIHSNGMVDEFYRPVTVGELTVDYPNHFICDAQELAQHQQDMAPMREQEEMELGEVYFLLLRSSLQDTPLTRQDVAALLSKARVARQASSYRDLQHKMMNMIMLPMPAPAPSPGSQPYDNDNNTTRIDSKPEQSIKEDPDHHAGPQITTLVYRELLQKVIEESRLQAASRRAFNNPRSEPSPAKNGSNTELHLAFARHLLAKSCARSFKHERVMVGYSSTSVNTLGSTNLQVGG